MNKFPKLSVIILTYNGSRYIGALLESLVSQSYPKDQVELIIVDNASTDNTLSIARNHYPKVKIVPLKKNIGFAAGNNQGFLKAQHNLLVFLNQDTVCQHDFLRRLVDIMVTNEEVAACNPNIITTTPDRFEYQDKKNFHESLSLCDLAPFGYGYYRTIYGKNFYYSKLLSGCAFIIRREVVAKLGYLYDDQIWMYAEDTDLGLRIHNIGLKTGIIKDAVVYHLHGRNIDINMNNLFLSAQAIMNRPYVFYKNMTNLEFLLFFPFLIFGGVFKFFEFPLRPLKKILYFIPFSIFSMICMTLAVFKFGRFSKKRRQILKQRRQPGLPMLKFILKI